jgi:glycosyltransferase involved in cell wall biosynthesis
MTIEHDRDAPRAMIIATNFPPDAAVGTLRTLRLVRHLAETGWKVTVVTAASEGFRRGTVIDPALLDRVPPAVEVIRARALRPAERLGHAFGLTGRRGPVPSPAQPDTVPVSPAPVSPGWLRQIKRAVQACLALPDAEVSWLLPAVARGWSEGRRRPPDIIFASGPPFTAHLVASLLSGWLRTPLVLDFRDPWARAPWREDRFEFERRAWRVLERLVVRRADAMIVTTETNCRDFQNAYDRAISQRFHVVANGCDTTEFTGLPGDRQARETFVLLHAGSLYGARNPAPLFRALRRAIDSGRIETGRFKLRFVGRASLSGVNLPAVIADAGLDRVVEFGGHAPRRTVIEEMRQASALLILQPITTFSIPAKLYEYMAAGRPILALAEPGGETARLVERSHAGLAVSADDERAIEDALISVMALADGAFVPVAGHHYDGAARAAETARILSDVVGRRRGVFPRSRADLVPARSEKEASQP